MFLPITHDALLPVDFNCIKLLLAPLILFTRLRCRATFIRFWKTRFSKCQWIFNAPWYFLHGKCPVFALAEDQIARDDMFLPPKNVNPLRSFGFSSFSSDRIILYQTCARWFLQEISRHNGPQSSEYLILNDISFSRFFFFFFSSEKSVSSLWILQDRLFESAFNS